MSTTTAAEFRMIDLMCSYHRELILTTYLWPLGYQAGNHNPGNNACHDCGRVGAQMPTGRATLLPELDQVEDAATHEAGHTIAYLAQAVPVDYAVLEPPSTQRFNAHISVPLPDAQIGTSVELVGLWGGQVATRHWMRRYGVDTDANLIDAVGNSGNDMQKMYETGLATPDILAARDVAEDLIDRHWDAVERVADMLLARGRLCGDELAQLADLHFARHAPKEG